MENSIKNFDIFYPMYINKWPNGIIFFNNRNDSCIKLLEKSILMENTKNSLSILYEEIESVSLDFPYGRGYYGRMLRINLYNGKKNIIYGIFTEADSEKIRMLLIEKNVKVHAFGMEKFDIKSLKLVENDKEGIIFPCSINKGNLWGASVFSIFLVIFLLIYITSKTHSSWNNLSDIVRNLFVILLLLSLLIVVLIFLFYLIRDYHAGITIGDGKIILRIPSDTGIDKKSYLYSDINNIKISNVDNNVDIIVKTNDNSETTIKNIKKGKALKEELIKKGVNII